jgi:hypothetical protein
MASCCYHPSTVGAVQGGAKQTGLDYSYDQEKTRLLLRKHIFLLTLPCKPRVHNPSNKSIHSWTDSDLTAIDSNRPVTLLE